MPEKRTVERAKQDLREGKSPSTAAGEFVREEIEHIRHGKHGARSTQQAIAIGLSKARRAGIPLPPPKEDAVDAATRRSIERAYEVGQRRKAAKKPSRKRAATALKALEREPRKAASKAALAAHAKSAAARRRARGTARGR